MICLLYLQRPRPDDPRLESHSRVAIVLHAIGWSLVFVLLGLWSLAAWALHALVDWTSANAHGLTAVTWLQPLAGPVLDPLLSQAPVAADVLSVAIWVVWAAGALALVLLGITGHRLLAGAGSLTSTLAAAAASLGSVRWMR